MIIILCLLHAESISGRSYSCRSLLVGGAGCARVVETMRPMMYPTLSYDHRIIDGKEAVQFLVTIKNVLEKPSRLLPAV